jgi:cardiolipin synthase (CMP-forming)
VAERPVARPLTFRRLTGLDRSGPPPPETRAGQPLRPWTIPNAIGFVRLALIPVFLVLALSSDSGTDPLPAIIFAVVAWGDYADGMAARITRQYSRLGALMDPVIDRLLVVAGVVVCWHFELLPRWALAVLVARELAVVVFARVGMSRGLDLEINWPGRASVWPLMSGLFFALAGVDVLAEVLFFVGLALSLLAFALYLRDGLRKTPPTPSS